MATRLRRISRVRIMFLFEPFTIRIIKNMFDAKTTMNGTKEYVYTKTLKQFELIVWKN